MTSSPAAAVSQAGSNPPAGSGSPISSTGMRAAADVAADLFERIAALSLAAAGPVPAGGFPGDPYQERTGADGRTTVVATEDYRAWFCRQYGVPRDEVSRLAPGTAGSAGGGGAPASGGWREGRMKRQTP